MSSSSVGPTIRPADAADDRALAEVDMATWAPIVTPADRWPADHTLLPEGVDPRDVLVAELDGSIAGYLKLGAPTPLSANRHVLEVQGLAVSPAHQRRGVARGLLAAAVEGGAQPWRATTHAAGTRQQRGGPPALRVGGLSDRRHP